MIRAVPRQHTHLRLFDPPCQVLWSTFPNWKDSKLGFLSYNPKARTGTPKVSTPKPRRSGRRKTHKHKRRSRKHKRRGRSPQRRSPKRRSQSEQKVRTATKPKRSKDENKRVFQGRPATAKLHPEQAVKKALTYCTGEKIKRVGGSIHHAYIYFYCLHLQILARVGKNELCLTRVYADARRFALPSAA